MDVGQKAFLNRKLARITGARYDDIRSFMYDDTFVSEIDTLLRQKTTVDARDVLEIMYSTYERYDGTPKGETTFVFRRAKRAIQDTEEKLSPAI